MSDSDVREILRATLELLKTQMVYLRNLHEGQSALHDALLLDHPELAENLEAELGKIRINPVQPEQIERIDELLQKLS